MSGSGAIIPKLEGLFNIICVNKRIKVADQICYVVNLLEILF